MFYSAWISLRPPPPGHVATPSLPLPPHRETVSKSSWVMPSAAIRVCRATWSTWLGGLDSELVFESCHLAEFVGIGRACSEPLYMARSSASLGKLDWAHGNEPNWSATTSTCGHCIRTASSLVVLVNIKVKTRCNEPCLPVIATSVRVTFPYQLLILYTASRLTSFRFPCSVVTTREFRHFLRHSAATVIKSDNVLQSNLPEMRKAHLGRYVLCGKL